jgi:hypothetical protein
LTKDRPLVLEGVEKRFAQGIEKGIEKGLLLEAQESVLEALEERFGYVDESLKPEFSKFWLSNLQRTG